MTTAWERAVRAGDVPTLQFLIHAGEDVDQQDRYGQTGVMLATLEGHLGAVEWLIGAGADLDHTAKFGLSALMLAAINGRLAISSLLVAAGADTSLRGSGAPGFIDMTALDLARQHGDDDVTAVLEPAAS